MHPLIAEIIGLDLHQNPAAPHGQITNGLSRSIIAFLLMVFSAGPAFTQATCQQQLVQLSQQFDARHGHQHMGPVVTFMRDQLRAGTEECIAGQEHEAVLRMDLVRAYLNLPEIAQPHPHKY